MCQYLGYTSYSSSDSLLFPGSCITDPDQALSTPNPPPIKPLTFTVSLTIALIAFRIMLINTYVPDPSKASTIRTLQREKSVSHLSSLSSLAPNPTASHLLTTPLTKTTIPRLLSQIFPHGSDHKTDVIRRIRFSNGAFRCVWTMLMSIFSIIAFKSLTWWPQSLQGTGSTLECWNLKGSIVLPTPNWNNDALPLTYFYLSQVSYHLSSYLFTLYNFLRSPTPLPRFRNIGLLSHSLELTLLSASYVLESTRRLGALSIFTFNASQFGVNLWQVIENSTLPQRQPKISTLTYYIFVITPYLYLRFYVFPFVIFRSFLLESQTYLEQIAMATEPWVARSAWYWFAIFLGGLGAMNVYYGFRLIKMRPKI
ncbi:hypothetical protein TrVE_jg3105 [Triparma verrucosa]|uniref:TLC domain-containing protein n=2 Tax=Triparma TaxID=722752 RepID=A0A9W7EHR6_9STRA|nr:hypothetical protein TrST_g5575 [Triparma strigata]GMI12621.1 hypothetical protein TrVE_jg3105 [Triparma verrucosa]